VPTAGALVNNQYQSGGIFRQNQLTANFTVRSGRVSLFGYYALNFAKANASGFGSYPSVPYKIGVDYGRASFDVRNRLFVGGSITLPHLIVLSPLIVAQSGNPYNIVTGTDLNYDNTYNDRPSFATAASKNPVHTAYGDFNRTPQAGETIIPVEVVFPWAPAIDTRRCLLMSQASA